MTVLAIPCASEPPRYTQRTQIDGATYTLGFHWNDRDGAWYLDFGDADGNAIMSGRKLVIESDLLQTVLYDARVPRGLLVAWDTTDSGEDPGRNDLGSRVVLRYYTADEL